MILHGATKELYSISASNKTFLEKKRLLSRKLAILLIAVSVLFVFFLQKNVFVSNKQEKNVIVASALPSPSITSVPTALPTPTKHLEAPPHQLVIPKLSLTAAVESVTVDEQNRMGVPVGLYNVGWYSYGVKPGEDGTALLDGHYDLSTGAPGIFYNLKTLVLGDIIEIYTIAGKRLEFIVQEVSTFPSDNFPYDMIFSQNTEKRIALITCSGIWNYQTRDYSQRTVVFATFYN